ncbi:MAG: phage portal protein [Planctomycetales bacterium]|nr:phage portal protein [Planctomycetales bacterium]
MSDHAPTSGATATPNSSWHARLEETINELWDNVVDPREAYVDTDGTWWDEVGAFRGGSRGAVAGPFRSEMQLREIRERCRDVALRNEFAINGHENRVSYVIGSGHTYQAVARHDAAGVDDLPASVQSVIDNFVAENHWHQRQQELFRRRDRDGEVFLRYFFDPDGHTRVRFVEPEQVATPAELAHDPSASYGIQTDPEDVETVWSYFIDGVAVPADEIQHRRIGVDCNVKRGLPLFYPVLKNLQRAEKLLRNMSVVAGIQSAIALIRRHRGATSSGVQQFVQDTASERVTNSGTGQTTSYRRYPPGTILDTHGGVEYDFPATNVDAASYVALLQAELRAVASRLVMPEFMLGSNASNANYSSTMMAEGPAVKMFERLQAEQKEDDLALIRRVVRHAASRGVLPEDVLDVVDIRVGLPRLVSRDALKEAQLHRIELQQGILSPQTWSMTSGLDYAQEQSNIEKHRRQNADVTDVARTNTHAT